VYTGVIFGPPHPSRVAAEEVSCFPKAGRTHDYRPLQEGERARDQAPPPVGSEVLGMEAGRGLRHATLQRVTRG
jgi:hypothetical protein